MAKQKKAKDAEVKKEVFVVKEMTNDALAKFTWDILMNEYGSCTEELLNRYPIIRKTFESYSKTMIVEPANAKVWVHKNLSEMKFVLPKDSEIAEVRKLAILNILHGKYHIGVREISKYLSREEVTEIAQNAGLIIIDED